MISWEILKIPVKRICIMSRCRRKRINRFFYIRKDTQSEIFSIRIRKKSCNYAITFWKIMFIAFERKLFSNIKAQSFSTGVFIMSSKKYTFNRLIWLQTRIFIKKLSGITRWSRLALLSTQSRFFFKRESSGRTLECVSEDVKRLKKSAMLKVICFTSSVDLQSNILSKNRIHYLEKKSIVPCSTILAKEYKST